MAALIEEAGFDIWLSDHLVLIEGAASRYPFSEDGQFFQEADDDWYEFVATAAYLAGVTAKAELAVGVCIPALRQPVELAKQLATLDRLSAGRLRFGVGTGWLAEEFLALGVPFQARGARLDAVLDVLNAVWSGRPPRGQYGPYEIPAGVCCYPTPKRPIPIYVGGTSNAAVRRVVDRGDAWLGMAPGGRIEPEIILDVEQRIAELCEQRDRDPTEIELAFRMGVPKQLLGTSELVERFAQLRRVGVQRFVLDIGWRDLPDARGRLLSLREALDAAAVELPPADG
jgi:probable F420-dependent oxidoreductase